MSRVAYPGIYGPSGPKIALALSNSAAAYTAGNAIGSSVLSIPIGRVVNVGGILYDATILDASNTKPLVDLLLFTATPATPPSDNAAYALAAADAGNVKRLLVGSSYQTYGSIALATLSGIGLKLTPVSGSQAVNLVAVIQSSVTLTLNCLTILLGFEED